MEIIMFEFSSGERARDAQTMSIS